MLAKGICWSYYQNPTVGGYSSYYILSDATTNSFTETLTGLSLGSTYYVRAFATNAAGTAYSEQLAVTPSYVVPATGSKEITISDSTWVYDVGGPTANYPTNCNVYLVIKVSMEAAGKIYRLGEPENTCHSIGKQHKCITAKQLSDIPYDG